MSRFAALLLALLTFAALGSSPAAALLSRPPGEGPTEVEIAVVIVDVDDIDSANQTFTANVYVELAWMDSTLAAPAEDEGPRVVPLDSIWHPRGQIINQQRVVWTFGEVAEIEPSGRVVQRARGWGHFSQPLDLRDFPFDEQRFEIQFVSTGYPADQVSFRKHERVVSGLAETLSLADWKVTSWAAGPWTYAPIEGTEQDAGFLVSFEAERRSGYFVLKIMAPLALIVMMSWVVFWIDPKESGTQINVAITSMLTLIAYRFVVDSLLPRVSYLTRLDWFILLSTILVFVTLVEALLTALLYERDRTEAAYRLDLVSRVLFPSAFVAVFVFTLFW